MFDFVLPRQQQNNNKIESQISVTSCESFKAKT